MSQVPTSRRIVLLAADEQGPVDGVLKEYAPAEASGTRLHADLRELGAQHPGRLVAAEWQGERGWVRFLWFRA